VEYPFAELRLKTDGARVLKDLEVGEGDWVNLIIAADEDGQLILRPMLQDRIREFAYDETYGLALTWFPRGADGPVLVDPRIAFGAPVLKEYGLPTWVVKGRHEAGESAEEIVKDFDIPLVAVRQALEFENVALPAAA
jgi:uncharacterized protein (DUF433 family)